MSDHISGPRAIADPVIDITDVYAFPCPGSPQHLVLIMNVFPYAGPSALFSDAVIYRLRVRSVVPHQNLVHSENERVANGWWRDVSIRFWP
jgi:Domain of unknown function (DUF4331)